MTNVELDIAEWKPVTEEGKAAVRAELERLLAHPQFSQSKRYPPFLRAVVLRALDDAEPLKERDLGLQVFGKSPDYDTSSNSVVRVTATEIRKRLTLYYHQPENQHGIQIDLPPGTYLPKFLVSESFEQSLAPTDTGEVLSFVGTQEESPKQIDVPVSPKDIPSRSRSWQLLIAVVALLGVSAALLAVHKMRGASSKDLWAPVIDSTGPIWYCLPDQRYNTEMILQDASNPEHHTVVGTSRELAEMTDLPTLVSLTGVAQVHHRNYQVRGTNSTSLDDLRSGPAVLIGSFNNPWTLRLTAGLRFHFDNDPEMQELRIVDRQNPANTSWRRGAELRGRRGDYVDYALLTRFLSPDTGQYVLVVAGLGHGGTIAAGEFVVSARDMESLMSQAPRGWSGRGVEAVIKTTVVQDEAGPPYIVATHFW